MLMKFRTKNGQSTVELIVLLVLVIVALLSIQPYLKRGLQGRWKQNADDIGDQYSVGNTNFVRRVEVSGKTRDTFGLQQGVSRTQLLNSEVTKTEERSVILNTDQEYMGK